MKRLVLAVLFFSAGFGSANASNPTPPYPASMPIPVADILVNFNGGGLDWVYAGPVANVPGHANLIAPSSTRAAEGWRAATAAEWQHRPTWDSFIAPGNPGHLTRNSSTVAFNNHNNYIFASEYWTSHSTVDIDDFWRGNVTDGVNFSGVLGTGSETIYVRNTLAVPEPETYAMMLAGLVLLGVASRRRVAK
ncbi:PEP-CTERM sorting domain-containing protein [Rugamonas apoptosis]|uniref:PEP-CTERM sorting domain-containing protein n=1 Tax=Rugamonas apoptosis TaxID=2758570 RepID=A0A7W2ILW8_9BURK|nr:PEP-CTERM sorting domain-containing protein [Rugamonas apoptosis]MBA5688969.1 PEP-CTERM sorting domain-containing protein [Rugamonas apoptosis]